VRNDFIANSALLTEDAARLAAALQLHPAWPDLPVILLTHGGMCESPPLLSMMESLSNTCLLEVSASIHPLVLRTALRTVARQYQIRDKQIAQKRERDALRASEERYRELFNEIDEGFCIIEIIFDENQKPIDYRLLDTNLAFEKQAGFMPAQGKRISELAPTARRILV